jgi:hypothetical protein
MRNMCVSRGGWRGFVEALAEKPQCLKPRITPGQNGPRRPNRYELSRRAACATYDQNFPRNEY